MSQITIRNYQPSDESAIVDITFKTGFMGEDLTGRGYCDDSRLWYMLFIGYYARYEPEHFFVAVNSDSEKVVGFICGTPDTLRQEAKFKKKMVPRIVFRLLRITSWRYPHSFKTVLGMMRWVSSDTDNAKNNPIVAQYPAHLHINLLPNSQSKGLGTRLIQQFEEHMRDLGVKGVHLGTSNKNKKAVPFYHKMGFSILEESGIVPHPTFGDLIFLTFAKKL